MALYARSSRILCVTVLLDDRGLDVSVLNRLFNYFGLVCFGFGFGLLRFNFILAATDT